eukprot:CAMPEP_0174982776 /NCGR_PEP_ID=MMETSP0004_2-20121128/16726_1 /TAXON_ID=420556 /ORGANISM="Ochromonas sp., Strain CCMP1393" /LENGTH=162 /DNA_ID=CAMNT_0016234855 /DNA_START=109 /DNA_END=597 /DNA_ORIENTATION=-
MISLYSSQLMVTPTALSALCLPDKDDRALELPRRTTAPAAAAGDGCAPSNPEPTTAAAVASIEGFATVELLREGAALELELELTPASEAGGGGKSGHSMAMGSMMRSQNRSAYILKSDPFSCEKNNSVDLMIVGILLSNQARRICDSIASSALALWNSCISL